MSETVNVINTRNTSKKLCLHAFFTEAYKRTGNLFLIFYLEDGNKGPSKHQQ
jgi:hypothetical protein